MLPSPQNLQFCGPRVSCPIIRQRDEEKRLATADSCSTGALPCGLAGQEILTNTPGWLCATRVGWLRIRLFSLGMRGTNQNKNKKVKNNFHITSKESLSSFECHYKHSSPKHDSSKRVRPKNYIRSEDQRATRLTVWRTRTGPNSLLLLRLHRVGRRGEGSSSSPEVRRTRLRLKE